MAATSTIELFSLLGGKVIEESTRVLGYSGNVNRKEQSYKSTDQSNDPTYQIDRMSSYLAEFERCQQGAAFSQKDRCPVQCSSKFAG